MKLSDQQIAIVESVAKNDSDIQVIARAGCGKTTTILSACGVAKGKVAFFAFNKAIADELAKKAPSHVNVQTIHSLGFSSLRHLFHGKVQVDNDKTYHIFKVIVSPKDGDLEFSVVKNLVSLCKKNLTEPTDENLYSLADEYQIDINGDANRVFEYVRKILVESVPTRLPAIIDFDDMIWLPIKFGFKGLAGYDWTFVDEAQDMNPAQQELILAVSRTGKICYVGDPAQAIYHFAGADSSGMENLQKKLENLNRKVVTLPLTLTRRCPKEIVKMAQYYVKDFEALEEAPEGKIETIKELESTPGDMVLCRMNAPLVPVAYKLLRAGVPVKIQGRDIGAGLVSLVRRMKAINIDDLLTRINSYQVRESDRIKRQYSSKPTKLENAISALNDRILTLVSLASGQTSIDSLIQSIEKLFVNVTSADSLVLLSTVHKAKGLEAPTVWIIETKPFSGPQEGNIRYVAITRAKNRLVLVPESEGEEKC